MSGYANNPATSLNSFVSSFRNNILSSSVAIVMYGYSKTFKRERNVRTIMILSIAILLISMCIGINASRAHYKYIKVLESDRMNVPPYVDFKAWYMHLYTALAYNAVLLIVLLLTIRRLMTR